MPAEPAAGAGATTPNQSINGAGAPASPEATPPATRAQETHGAPIGDRMPELEMLTELDVPTEILEKARLSAEKEAKEKETGQQQQPAASPAQPAQPVAHVDDDEEPITEEQRRGDPEKVIAQLFSRLGKKTARLSEKDAEIARLRTQVGGQRSEDGDQKAAPAAPATAAPGDGKFAALKTEAELVNKARVSREIRNWALLNLEGATDVAVAPEQPGGEPRTRDFSAAEVRQMLVEATDDLELHIPSRAIQLQQGREMEEQRQRAEEVRPKWEAIGVEDYPDLTNPESELSKYIDVLLETYPFLKTAPDGRVTAADIVSAALKRRDRAEAAGLVPKRNGNGPTAAPVAAATPDPALRPFLAPKPPRAPAVPSTAHGAPPPPPTDAELKQARDDYQQGSHSDEEFTEYIDRLSQAQAGKGAGRAVVAPARV